MLGEIETSLINTIINFNPNQFAKLLAIFKEEGANSIKELDINAKNGEGKNALHYAALSKNSLFLTELLTIDNVNINIQDNDGSTALHLAIRDGNTQYAEQLLLKMTDLNIQEHNGKTPLYLAAQFGYLSIVKQLLKFPMHLNLQENDCGKTPLYIAAEHGFAEIVKELIINFADPKICEMANGQDALTIAIKNKHRGVVELLMYFGCGIGRDLPSEITMIPLNLDYCFLVGSTINGKKITREKQNFARAITDLKQLVKFNHQLDEISKKIRTNQLHEGDYLKLLRRFELEYGFLRRNYDGFTELQKIHQSLCHHSINEIKNSSVFKSLFTSPYKMLIELLLPIFEKNTYDKEIYQFYRHLQLNQEGSLKDLILRLISHDENFEPVRKKALIELPCELKEALKRNITLANLFPPTHSISHKNINSTIAYLKRVQQNDLRNYLFSLKNYPWRRKELFAIFDLCLLLLCIGSAVQAAFISFNNDQMFTAIKYTFLALAILSVVGGIMIMINLFSSLRTDDHCCTLFECNSNLLRKFYQSKNLGSMTLEHKNALLALKKLLNNLYADWLQYSKETNEDGIKSTLRDLIEAIIQLNKPTLKIRDVIIELEKLDITLSTLIISLPKAEKPIMIADTYAGVGFFPMRKMEKLRNLPPPIEAEINDRNATENYFHYDEEEPLIKKGWYSVV